MQCVEEGAKIKCCQVAVKINRCVLQSDLETGRLAGPQPQYSCTFPATFIHNVHYLSASALPQHLSKVTNLEAAHGIQVDNKIPACRKIYDYCALGLQRMESRWHFLSVSSLMSQRMSWHESGRYIAIDSTLLLYHSDLSRISSSGHTPIDS